MSPVDQRCTFSTAKVWSLFQLPEWSLFRLPQTAFPNLTLKKVPTAVLNNCEWGRDDYSMGVSALPAAPTPEEEEAKRIENLRLFQKEKQD